MIPTIESMNTIGVPARVSATKITPRAISSAAPAASRPAAIAQTAAPIANPPTRARAATRSPARPWPASRVAPSSAADR